MFILETEFFITSTVCSFVDDEDVSTAVEDVPSADDDISVPQAVRENSRTNATNKDIFFIKSPLL